MKCFVIAMEKEAAPVTGEMQNTKRYEKHGKHVIYGTLYGEETAVIICGVGKVNAACGTQYAVDELHADTIINVGFAGGLNGGVKVGEIYSVSEVVQYDFDLTQLNGTQIGTLDEFNENYLPLDICGGFPQKRLATGDRFNDSTADFLLLTKTLNADLRDMEGGAIAQTCIHANVKCREYKIVSDVAGSGSTTEQYLKNIAVCAQSLQKNLRKIFTEGK